MKKLPLKEAKKQVLNSTHAQFIRMTKEQLIQALLRGAKLDLETMPASEVNLLLLNLTKGKMGCEIPDNQNN